MYIISDHSILSYRNLENYLFSEKSFDLKSCFDTSNFDQNSFYNLFFIAKADSDKI
jgi:hypothetical protein